MKSGIGILYTIGFAFIVLVIYLKLAFWGSLVMSTVKPIAEDCGTQYRFEAAPLFTGNWFCPSK